MLTALIILCATLSKPTCPRVGLQHGSVPLFLFFASPADAYVKAVLLGTVEPPVLPGGSGTASVQLWSDRIRTDTITNTIEEWDIVNLTPDGKCVVLY
jgi:hypothetical protein